jgi:hypothetical protein
MPKMVPRNIERTANHEESKTINPIGKENPSNFDL